LKAKLTLFDPQGSQNLHPSNGPTKKRENDKYLTN